MALKPGIFASVPFAQQHHGTFSGVVSVGETLENSHGKSDSAALQLPLRRSGIVSRSSMTSSTRAGDSFVHSTSCPRDTGSRATASCPTTGSYIWTCPVFVERLGVGSVYLIGGRGVVLLVDAVPWFGPSGARSFIPAHAQALPSRAVSVKHARFARPRGLVLDRDKHGGMIGLAGRGC